MSFEFQVFLIIFVPYLMLAYTFLFPALILYFFSQHSWRDKLAHFITFILTPPVLLPFGTVVFIGFSFLRLVGGVLVICLFAFVSILGWINAHFPFGGVFKAWLKVAALLLEKMRVLLEMLGLKELLGLHKPKSTQAMKPMGSVETGSAKPFPRR